MHDLRSVARIPGKDARLGGPDPLTIPEVQAEGVFSLTALGSAALPLSS